MEDEQAINEQNFDLENRFNQLPQSLLSLGCCVDRRESQKSQEHLQELNLLIRSYGGEVVDSMMITLRTIDPGTWMGKGKLEEVKERLTACGALGVVVDDELSPSQQRNLEEHLGCPVADRTEVILAVFAHHARSKEAKIQISLAQAQYFMPRLKRMWTHLSRQRGGGVNQKGEGERQIEIDRRILKKKMERYRSQLEEIQNQRLVQNKARDRSGVPVVAIIGYTNAGKSTFLNSMTDAGVFVEDKLFATLDTTTRKFTLPNEQEILFVDTVGFIRKLPHNLIAAFRSTLEQSTHADLLIHLVDGSSCVLQEQIDATLNVLEELEALNIPRLLVFNKADLMSEQQKMEAKLCYGSSIFISALEKTGIEELCEAIEKVLSQRRSHLKLCIPHHMSSLVSLAHELGSVRSKEYVDEGVLLDLLIDHEHCHHFLEFETLSF